MRAPARSAPGQAPRCSCTSTAAAISDRHALSVRSTVPVPPTDRDHSRSTAFDHHRDCASAKSLDRPGSSGAHPTRPTPCGSSCATCPSHCSPRSRRPSHMPALPSPPTAGEHARPSLETATRTSIRSAEECLNAASRTISTLQQTWILYFVVKPYRLS